MAVVLYAGHICPSYALFQLPGSTLIGKCISLTCVEIYDFRAIVLFS